MVSFDKDLYTTLPLFTQVYLTILAEWAIDSEAMRARGIIVLVKSD